MKRTPIRKKRTKPRPGRLKGKDLSNLRLDCFLRDEGRCTNCGRQVLFDAHHLNPASFHMAHIIAKRIGGDNLANIETNCGECHRIFHACGPSRVKPVPPKERAA